MQSSREQKMEEHKKRLIRSQDPATYDEASEYPCKKNCDDEEEKEDANDRMIRFLCTVGQLKSIDRTGWIIKDRDIQKPETVAGHMYRMGIIAMLLEEEEEEDDEDLVDGEMSKDSIKDVIVMNGNDTSSSSNENDKFSRQKLDISKLVKMSLIHDIAECIVGDITPFDGVSQDEKHRREAAVMKHLGTLLPRHTSRQLMRLFAEYEERRTAESIVVKELDRFEVMLQAFQYERREWTESARVVRFDEFFDYAIEFVHHPRLRAMLHKIILERDRFFREQICPKQPNQQ